MGQIDGHELDRVFKEIAQMVAKGFKYEDNADLRRLQKAMA